MLDVYAPYAQHSARVRVNCFHFWSYPFHKPLRFYDDSKGYLYLDKPRAFSSVQLNFKANIVIIQAILYCGFTGTSAASIPGKKLFDKPKTTGIKRIYFWNVLFIKYLVVTQNHDKFRNHIVSYRVRENLTKIRIQLDIFKRCISSRDRLLGLS